METPTQEPVLKASEIGQFAYCSVAWQLVRQGCKPESPALEKGLQEHADLGVKIETLSETERASERLSYVGYALILVAVAMFIWWLVC
jgi:glucose-6-phosphate dehydrogenase assembly protein OpcA